MSLLTVEQNAVPVDKTPIPALDIHAGIHHLRRLPAAELYVSTTQPPILISEPGHPPPVVLEIYLLLTPPPPPSPPSNSHCSQVIGMRRILEQKGQWLDGESFILTSADSASILRTNT